LVGALVSLATGVTDTLPTEQLIRVLSGAVFAAYALVLLALGLRIIQRSAWSTHAILAVVVFCSSPFIVLSGHLMGYYDNIIVVLTVVSIALVLEDRIWLGAGVQAIAMLVHETSLLIGFPVFCLTWLLVNGSRNTPGKGRLPVGPLLLPIAAFGLVGLAQSLLLPADFEQSFARHLTDFPFIQDRRSTLVPRWLVTTFFEYALAGRAEFVHKLSSLEMYGLILPSMLAILCLTVDAYGITELSAKSIALLGAGLTPQVLHVIAWDTPRVWSYSILCFFLALWVHAEVFTAQTKLSSSLTLLCLAALVVNILGLTPLMDGETERLGLTMRLLLYAPAIGFVLSLILRKGSVTIEERDSPRRRAPAP
jgi:hypothetical protein